MDRHYKGTRQAWRDRLYAEVKRSPVRLQGVARRMAHDDDEGVRWMVADDLGRVGRPNDGWTGDFLMRMLGDREAIVRTAAVEALANLRYRPAVVRFCERLRGDPDFVVRSTAAEALGEVRADEGVDVLLEAVCRDPVSTVRSCAANAVGLIGRRDALEALDTQVTRERDPCVLGEIHGARARLGAGGGIGGLLRCVDDADELQVIALLGVLEDLVGRETPRALVEHWGTVRGALEHVALRHTLVRGQVDKIVGLTSRWEAHMDGARAAR